MWLVESYGATNSFGFAFRCARVGVMFGLISPLQIGMAPAQMVMLSKGGMRSGDTATVLLFKNIMLVVATSLLLGVFLVWKRTWLGELNKWLFILILVAFVLNIIYLVLLFFIGRNQKQVTGIAHALIRFLAKLHVVKDPENLQERAALGRSNT